MFRRLARVFGVWWTPAVSARLYPHVLNERVGFSADAVGLPDVIFRKVETLSLSTFRALNVLHLVAFTPHGVGYSKG